MKYHYIVWGQTVDIINCNCNINVDDITITEKYFSISHVPDKQLANPVGDFLTNKIILPDLFCCW